MDRLSSDLRVASPPEGDALERGVAHEVRGGAVLSAAAAVLRQQPVLGAGAARARLRTLHPLRRILRARQQAQPGAVETSA